MSFKDDIKTLLENLDKAYKFGKYGFIRDDIDATKINYQYYSLLHPLHMEDDASGRTGGSYADFSLTLFMLGDNRILITICVGSERFANDYAAARQPWWRREYLGLTKKYPNLEIKSYFSDLDSELPVLSTEFDDDQKAAGHIKEIKKIYGSLIQAAQIVRDTDNYKEILENWFVLYFYLSGGRTTAIQKVYNKINATSLPNYENEVTKLLKEHKYVVLQGAPGTGKTRLATEIADKHYKDRMVFTQFHAETSYTDFVGGLVPNTKAEGNGVKFEHYKGSLVEAIEKAENDPENDYLLIIDEINRANLSNVLGPVFYLFEKNANGRAGTIKLSDEVEISELPKNLHVIATMNTADRSLAVVDYALRRRFVWYTLRPHSLQTNFHSEMFEKMAKIFRRYATDAELNLQPGHAYFIAPDEATMKGRLEYELMPLIKEYLVDGHLREAQTELEAYFREYLPGKYLFE